MKNTNKIKRIIAVIGLALATGASLLALSACTPEDDSNKVDEITGSAILAERYED